MGLYNITSTNYIIAIRISYARRRMLILLVLLNLKKLFKLRESFSFLFKMLANTPSRLDLDLYVTGTIFAMELVERNANIKFLLKKNSLCSLILQSLF